MLGSISTENNYFTKIDHPTKEVKEPKVINTSLNDTSNNTPIENRSITTDEINSSLKDVSLTDFDAVTARVKPKKMEVINEKLASIKADDISQLLDICSDPNLIQNNKKDFFLCKDFPYIALKALQQQDISASEFGTLANLHAVVLELMQENDDDEFPVVFHNLFNEDGSYNYDSWDIVENSLNNSDPNENFKDINLTYAIIGAMKDRISNKRPIETSFWTYKSDVKVRNNSNNISHRLNKIGAEMFFYLDQDLTMLPSLAMRQEFLNAVFRSNACHINPVIGITKTTDLRDGALIRSRDFGIPFPNLPLPKKADGMEAPRIVDFQHHDAYHEIRVSLLDDYNIKCYVGFGDALKELATNLSEKRNEIKKLALEKIALFEKFKDNLESLSDTNKEKAMIKLQREFYKIKKLIDFLDKNIKAISRFKFLLYDLEMPYTDNNSMSRIKFLGVGFHHFMNVGKILLDPYIVGENADVENFYAMVTGKKLTAYAYLNDFYSKDIDVSESKKLLISLGESLKKDFYEQWLAATDIETKKNLELAIKKCEISIQFMQPEKKYELTSLKDDNTSI